MNIQKYNVLISNLPLYNDRKHYNVNILVVDKIYKLYTISFSLLYHLFLHFYTEEPDNHPLGLRQVGLQPNTHVIICILTAGASNTVPFGITPGSMKVAKVKLANTKNVITP